MTRQQAIDFILRTNYKYYTFGLEGSDLGTPIERQDALEAIQGLDDDSWNGSGDEIPVIYACDSQGRYLENVITIQEEVRIPQGDQIIILEKGDRIKVEESTNVSLEEFINILEGASTAVVTIEDKRIGNANNIGGYIDIVDYNNKSKFRRISGVRNSGGILEVNLEGTRWGIRTSNIKQIEQTGTPESYSRMLGIEFKDGSSWILWYNY